MDKIEIGMSVLKKTKYTILPVNIWVSSDLSVNPREPRIHFQNNYSDKASSMNDLIPLSIIDGRFLDDKQVNISQCDLYSVRRFIELNRELLLKLWIQEIDDEDFRSEANFNIHQM
ncbi:MAG: hypothetical protein ACI4ND_07505 [Succinivibrio sp.]